MEKATAIIEMAQPFEVQTIVYPVTEAKIKEVEEKFKNFPTDLNIKKNYQFIKKGVSEVSKLITGTEAKRKELKKGALEYGRQVDSVAKEIKERLASVYSPMKKIKVDFDTAAEIAKREAERKEEERQNSISEKMDALRNIVTDNILSSSDVLKEAIKGIRASELAWAEEYEEKAQELKTIALIKLDELLKLKIQAENAEKLEKEREEKERIRQQELRAENAKVAEANKKQADELKAAQKKLDAEKAAVEKEKRDIKAAAKRKEREAAEEKIKAEQRQKAEKEAKIKAEKEEKARIEAEKLAAENLKGDIEATKNEIDIYCKDKKQAALLVTEIRNNKFKHLTWR